MMMHTPRFCQFGFPLISTGKVPFLKSVVYRCCYGNSFSTHTQHLDTQKNENVLFIALSCDQHPDHSTIAAFVSSMKDQIVPIFSDILMVCEEENLLGGTFFALLDGCKLPSNTSLEWSGKIKDLKKRKETIDRKVKALPEEQVETDKKETAVLKEMVVSRERQIETLKKQADRIENWLSGHDKKIGKPKNYFEGKKLTADSCYHSITNIEKCEEEGLDAYIPDNKFRIRGSRFSSQERFSPKAKNFSYFDFQYDDQNGHYICPNGKKLKCEAKRSKSGGRFRSVYAFTDWLCFDYPFTPCSFLSGIPRAVIPVRLRRTLAGIQNYLLILKTLDSGSHSAKRNSSGMTAFGSL